MILGSQVQRIVAAVSVTVLTLAVIGVVLVASTPLGCGPAKALHIKLSPTRCANVASIIPNSSPSPKGIPTFSPFPQATANPNPEPASNPFPEPASNPFPEPASNPGPFPGPVSNPYPDNSSGIFPPFAPPASGSAGPGLALTCRLPIYAGGPGSGGRLWVHRKDCGPVAPAFLGERAPDRQQRLLAGGQPQWLRLRNRDFIRAARGGQHNPAAQPDDRRSH